VASVRGALKIFSDTQPESGRPTRKYRLDTTSFLLDSELNELPTLRQTLEKFVSDEACLEHFGAVRWPDGPLCPKCRYPTM